MQSDYDIYQIKVNEHILIFYCHFYKGDNFRYFLFAFLHTRPLLKMSKLYVENVFSLLGRPLLRGGQNNFDRVCSPVSVSILVKAN